MRSVLSTLYGKTSLLIALTTGALIVELYFPLRFVLLASFLQLEETAALDDTERARGAVTEDIETLASVTRDYAIWDEACAFVAGTRPDFGTLNFVDATFSQNRLSFVVVADLQGNALYARGYDLVESRERPPPPLSVLLPGKGGPLLVDRRPDHELAGLLMTPQGPFLVAARAIVRSDRTGPAHGTLMMGRALDRREIDRLGRGLRLDVSFLPWSDPKTQAELGPLGHALTVGASARMRLVDEGHLAGYALVRDVHGEPALALKAWMPRAIYAQGRAATQYLLLAVVAAGLVFGAVMLVLLGRLVVRRVSRLSQDVGRIGAHPDHARRVHVEGEDELARLSQDINKMLDALEGTTRQLQAERGKSERLLRNILPASIVQRLKDKPETIADAHPAATVMFADLVGFTDLSARIPATELVRLLNGIFSRFDALADAYELEKIKTIGDAYMVVSGVPEPREDHAAAAAEMALAMLAALAEFNRVEGTRLDMRIGIHSGPVVAGVIGVKKFIYDLWGDTVNTASRMESTGVPGRIQVSAATHQLLVGDFRFEDRGELAVKGKGVMRAWLLGSRRQDSSSVRVQAVTGERTQAYNVAALVGEE